MLCILSTMRGADRGKHVKLNPCMLHKCNMEQDNSSHWCLTVTHTERSREAVCCHGEGVITTVSWITLSRYVDELSSPEI